MCQKPKTPVEEDCRLCFCFDVMRLTVPIFSPSYDINFKVEFLSTDFTKWLEILKDCFIWPNQEKILVGFIAWVSKYQDDLMRLTVFIFSTGYVINFKVRFLCTGLMNCLETWSEYFNLIALEDLLVTFF